MSSLKELRQKARDSGCQGYSTMDKTQLIQLLRGEKVVRYKKTQVHAATQTDFLECQDCALRTLMDQLSVQAERTKRKTTMVDYMMIDIETGEVLGAEVEQERGVYMNPQRTKKK